MAIYPVTSRCPGRKPPSEIHVEGDVAIISLTNGFKTVIDLADVEVAAGYRWCVLARGRGEHRYAVRYENGKCLSLHREILLPPKHLFVDHIDADGLNNRRSNIRIATPTQNSANKRAPKNNKLGVKGVHMSRGRFAAHINSEGKTIGLGRFTTLDEAVDARRKAAFALWGDFSGHEYSHDP